MATLQLRYEPSIDRSSATLFKRILVISDSTVGDAMREALDLHFYDVTVVHNGGGAVRLLAREHFDAVVCDFTTPDLPVEMFCHALERLRPELCRTLIMVTDSEQSSRTRRDIGAMTIWKPIDIPMLVGAVEIVLKKNDKASQEQLTEAVA